MNVRKRSPKTALLAFASGDSVGEADGVAVTVGVGVGVAVCARAPAEPRAHARSNRIGRKRFTALIYSCE
jgi:hypothetical protein